MSYEIRGGDQTLELPNPYAVENKVRFGLGAVLFGFGLAALLVARGRLAAGSSLGAALPVVAGTLLIAYAVQTIAIGMKHLRFFFGRDRPASLANDLGSSEGTSESAAHLVDIVRRGALPVEEPQRALDGVLYALMRDLIYAVRPIQLLARREFRIALVALAIALSLGLSALLATSAQAAWLGALYLALAFVTLTRPVGAGDAPVASDALPVVLVLLAVLGPVALALLGPIPTPGGLPLALVAAWMVLLLGGGSALYFAALARQVEPPPPWPSALHQLSVSMNCQPSQLVDELARRLVQGWRNGIPNRRYAFLRPHLEPGSSGSFLCGIFEETQPFPEKHGVPRSFQACMQDATRRRILWLQLYGAAVAVASAGALLLAAVRAQRSPLLGPGGVMEPLLFAVTGIVAAHHALTGAHILFGRFDFESTLTLVECKGNYQPASLEVGNLVSSQVRTKKTFVNVETATLQAWVVDLATVVFAKDAQRHIWAMRGRQDDARVLAESLARFAADQSTVVAPSSPDDARKLEGLTRLSAVANASAPPQLGAVTAVVKTPDGESG